MRGESVRNLRVFKDTAWKIPFTWVQAASIGSLLWRRRRRSASFAELLCIDVLCMWTTPFETLGSSKIPQWDFLTDFLTKLNGWGTRTSRSAGAGKMGDEGTCSLWKCGKHIIQKPWKKPHAFFNLFRLDDTVLCATEFKWVCQSMPIQLLFWQP